MNLYQVSSTSDLNSVTAVQISVCALQRVLIPTIYIAATYDWTAVDDLQ